VATEKPTKLEYRCLRDLHFALDGKQEVDEELFRRVCWEDELVRQAIDTPHALATSRLPPVYFEVIDYRIAWQAIVELLPLVPVGQSVPAGLLLAKFAELDGPYFRGQVGKNWLRYVMGQPACGLTYALEYLVPTLHARFEMRLWKVRTEDLINLVDKTNDTLLLHSDWRREAYAISLSHDGGAIGKTFADLMREWNAEDRDNDKIVPLGLKEIDRLNGGGPGRGELAVIGGPTGGGKSYLAERMMCNYAQAGTHRALYISTEDNPDLMTARLFADYCPKIRPREVRSKRADPALIDEARASVGNDRLDNLYFAYAKKATCSQICDLIRRHRYLCDVDIVLIDYLQAIMPDEQSNQKTNDTALMVSQLKKCADDVGVALVLFSQYARDEYRNGAEPSIVSCKWAGEIENEAEIMFLTWQSEDGKITFGKIAKLKWAPTVGRRYILPRHVDTGVFLEPWEPDFTQPTDNKPKPDGRRNGRRSGGEI
jgi:RecA/RadA recombinase